MLIRLLEINLIRILKSVILLDMNDDEDEFGWMFLGIMKIIKLLEIEILSLMNMYYIKTNHVPL